MLVQSNVYLKLPNPNANCFEYQELKDAMLKTVAQLNEWAEEYDITEVYCTVKRITQPLTCQEAISFEFCSDRW